MDRQIDGQMDGWINKWMDGYIDQLIHTQTEEWTDSITRTILDILLVLWKHYFQKFLGRDEGSPVNEGFTFNTCSNIQINVYSLHEKS